MKLSKHDTKSIKQIANLLNNKHNRKNMKSTKAKQIKTKNKKPLYTCDECTCQSRPNYDKPAKYNIQDQTVHYSIDKDGNFTEIDSIAEGDNLFLCEKHYQKYIA